MTTATAGRPKAADFLHCTSGCSTGGHASWGACLRAKALRIGYCRSSIGHDRTRQNKWDRELGLFAEAKDAGIMPDGTRTHNTRFAMDMSERFGGRYGTDFRVVPRDKGENPKYDAVFHDEAGAVMAEVTGKDADLLAETGRKLRGES